MTPQYIYINENGIKYYHKDKAMKIRHREDGPAIEYVNGDKFWCLNGELHREDGPAVEVAGRPDNNKWYVNGKYYTEKEFKKRTAKEIVLTMDEIADKLGIDVSKLKIAK